MAERSTCLAPLAWGLAAVLGCRAEASTAQPETGPAVASACGSSGLPDCPLQQWMKATLQSHQRSHDYVRLASSFRQLGAHAPPGYAGWADASEAGALAAERHDDAALSQTCKTCHEQHRPNFRRDLRAQKLF